MDERPLHETLTGGAQILRWPHTHPLPAGEVMAFFEARGIRPSEWTNAPGGVFDVHRHPYRKTLFCIRGAITFSLPDLDREVGLAPGDRLILPTGMRHGAIVGPDGVTCIEGAES